MFLPKLFYYFYLFILMNRSLSKCEWQPHKTINNFLNHWILILDDGSFNGKRVIERIQVSDATDGKVTKNGFLNQLNL